MRYDHLSMLPDNAFRKVGGRLATLEGGGGKGGGSKSAPAPTSQTVTNTSIPEYARPYVERMLGKSEALTDINQNPYQTYGGDRIAEFSPLQKQAFQNVANQTTSSQLGGATQLAGAAGLGALGTAGRMGGAGMDYMRMATNPMATQAFMNPYLQASLAPQLAEIQRQGTIAAQGLKGQSVAQGAFGGNRAALQQAENQRNVLNAQQQAIGQGYNTAFQNAQQAQQFGANLGLQGLQGALQGYGQAGAAAGTLGQLGQTEFGQQQAINAAQQQVGTVQQAQQQQQLDQAYQDFLKQQNYPYQQLAFMSDMLRGLPLSQSAQQQYTAPPSMVSQLGGLGMAGLGIYGASGGFRGAKDGGKIEEKYSGGGSINMKSEDELMAIINNKKSNPIEVAAAEEQLLLRSRLRNNPQARIGVGAISTGDMVPETMAGGGIVAFAGGKEVKSRVPVPTNIENQMANLQTQIDAETEALKGLQFPKSQEAMQAIQQDIKDREQNKLWNMLAMGGAKTAAGTSPYALVNFGGGAQAGLEEGQKQEALNAADRKLLLQQQGEQEKTDYAKRAAMLNVKQQSLTNLMNKELALQQIKASGSATAEAAMARVAAQRAKLFEDAVKAEKTSIQKLPEFLGSNPDQIESIAIKNVTARFQKYQPGFMESLGMSPGVSKASVPTAAPTGGAKVPKMTYDQYKQGWELYKNDPVKQKALTDYARNLGIVK